MKDKSKSEKITPDDARGGEVILKTRRRRLIFLGGLAGMIFVPLLIYLFSLI